VRDGDLDDLEPLHAGERRQEAVEPLPELDALDHLALEDLERAARVVDALVRAPVAVAVPDLARDAL
jgi:hypothetical protein